MHMYNYKFKITHLQAPFGTVLSQDALIGKIKADPHKSNNMVILNIFNL